MNKRISTLMTVGLLSVGALFSTVNAQNTEVAANTVFNGSTYYYLGDANGYYIGGESVKKGNAEQYTALNTIAIDASTVKGNDAYLWAIDDVTFNGKVYFTFKNKKTGTLLSFDANGGIVTAADGNKISQLTWLDANKYVAGGKVIAAANNQITISSASVSMTTTGTAIQVFKQDESTVTAAALNKALGTGFALSFPNANPQPAENIFDQKITAYDFSGKAWATGILSSGLYFAVSTPKAGIVDMETFKASTFIAVDPVNHFGINELKRGSGVGFTFRLVTGENLVLTNNTSKDQVYAGNAAFTVSEMDNINKPGEYTLKLASVRVKKDASKDDQANVSDVYVDAITSTGTTYVTTTSKPTTAKCTISTSNMVKASELLSKEAPSVFNVLFVSGEDDVTKDGSSEYGKYLGLRLHTTNGSYVMFAQGPDYVNLNAPQNQWVVTKVDGQNFTFTNREVNTYDNAGNATGVSFTVSLRKTDEANVYEAYGSENFYYAYVENNTYKLSTSGTSFNGTKIQLIPATVTPSAGYADYTDAELAELARLKFTVGSDVLYKDLFLKAVYNGSVPSSVEATQETLDAAEWEIIKFDCSAAESDVAKSDTIYGTTKYVYIVKDEEVKTKDVKDIAIVSYAFKLHIDGKAYYLNENTTGSYALIQEDDVEDAPRFIVKENKNGSNYLILAGSNRVYTSVINKDTKALALNEVDGKLKQESVYQTVNNVKASFYVVRDITTPSLPAVPRHAAFEALTGGFVAVGEANDAVIAPTSLEAENLTFWLDTANSKAYTPAFYISKGVDTTANAPRMFLYNAKDSAVYYNPGTASEQTNLDYYLVDRSVKAIFRPATLTGVDTLATTVAGKATEVTAANGLDNFKFQIVLKDAQVEGEYIIKSLSDANYIFNLNGKLGLTDDKSKALVVSVVSGIAPTANEAIANEVEGVKVIAGNGTVEIQGAAGKNVVIANILGKVVASTTLTSDNQTINVPAGIVVVTVDGEAVKAVVR